MPSEPVPSILGLLTGRDAIYLDVATFQGDTLKLVGEINGDLSSEPGFEAKWVAFTLEFEGVQECVAVEYERAAVKDEASFLVGCRHGFRASEPREHELAFTVCTYDQVFDIVALGFVADRTGERPKD